MKYDVMAYALFQDTVFVELVEATDMVQAVVLAKDAFINHNVEADSQSPDPDNFDSWLDCEVIDEDGNIHDVEA